MSERRKPGRPGKLTPTPQPLHPMLERGSDTPQVHVKSYWPGRLTLGRYGLIEGRKGTGKSTLLAALAASVTGGPPVPGWKGPRHGNVVYVSTEDAWDSVILPRMEAAGADTSMVHRLRPIQKNGVLRKLVLPDDIDDLREMFEAVHPALFIVDPVFSIVNSEVNINIPQQCRLITDPLNAALAQTDTMGLLSRNLKKGRWHDLREAGLGGVTLTDACGSLLRLDEHPTIRGRLCVSTVAINYGQRGAGLMFSLDRHESGNALIHWHGTTDLDADTIAIGQGTEAERDEFHDADSLLRHVLAEGPVKSATIQMMARDAGISMSTLRSAKARLYVLSKHVVKEGHQWWEWCPPSQGFPPGTEVADGDGPYANTRARLGGVRTLKPQRKPRKSTKDPRCAAHSRTTPPTPPTPLNGGSPHEEASTRFPGSQESSNGEEGAGTPRVETEPEGA